MTSENKKSSRYMRSALLAANNAQGIEIIRDDDSILFIGRFSSGETSEMVLTLTEVSNLLSSGSHEVLGAEGRIFIRGEMAYAYFEPTKSNCDLVCLRPRAFKRKLRKIFY